MKRRSLKTKFDSKVIIDVALAGLAMRVLPGLINKFVPLDENLYKVAAAGGTYLAGSMLKKPVMANAGIALGAVELVAPYIENLIGGITGTAPMVAPVGIVKTLPAGGPALPVTTMADFISLNDGSYIPYPTSSRDYASAY